MSARTLIPPRHRRTLAENVVRALVIALISAAVLGVCWVLRFLALPQPIRSVACGATIRVRNQRKSRTRVGKICVWSCSARAGDFLLTFFNASVPFEK